MRRVLHPILALAATSALLSQDRQTFDAASVKLHKGEVTFSADPSPRGRRVTATASTLLDMITYAYGVRYDQILGGPPWANSDHYDIEATSEGDGPLTTAQAKEMMRSLLAERFRLQVHRDRREVPVYALVVAKNGPKFKPAAEDAAGGMGVTAGEKGIHVEAAKATMEQLTRQLAFTADRPVLDRTGLTGYYTFKLDWYPANRIPPPDLDVPTMFAAAQEQLGLRLERSTGQVEKLVIDGVERPSAN